jgi:hypothetical protein
MAMFDLTILLVKCGKGKKKIANEERQFILSFLAISQNPIGGNGQQSVAFWECIVNLQ